MAFDPSSVVRQYGEPAEEVRACRNDCALFDFSFVALARIEGPAALDAIGLLTRRPLGDLQPGCIRYAVREDRAGHLVSDLTIWRQADAWEVMSGRPEDIGDLVGAGLAGCRVQDLSGKSAIFALQGPRSLAVLSGLMDVGAVAALRYFGFADAELLGQPCSIGRLGYTGEPGFEIVLPRAAAGEIWEQLARKARPAGFIAADVLRIEAGFVLFANEFRVPVTAAEAGLAQFAHAREQRALEIGLVCFQASAREVPLLWQPAGRVDRPEPGTIAVTSACHSAAAGGTLGLGFARRSDVEGGKPLRDPTGVFTNVRLVSLPFLDPHKRRPRAPWSEIVSDRSAPLRSET